MHFRVMDGDSGPSIPPALQVGDADAPQKQRSLMERPAADRLVFFLPCAFLSRTEKCLAPRRRPVAQLDSEGQSRCCDLGLSQPKDAHFRPAGAQTRLAIPEF